MYFNKCGYGTYRPRSFERPSPTAPTATATAGTLIFDSFEDFFAPSLAEEAASDEARRAITRGACLTGRESILKKAKSGFAQ